MNKFSPRTGSPTIGAARREIDNRKAGSIVRVMRVTGLSLSLSRKRGGRRWFPSNGEHVSEAVAREVIADSNVGGVGDGLFASAHSQVYRYAFLPERDSSQKT
jgi:hypothetical protein